MDYHHSQLVKHCRICGGRLISSKGKYKATVYQVGAFEDQLHKAFGVSTPQSFCKVCKVAMGRLIESKEKGIPYKSSVQLYQWQEHQENCKECEHFSVMAKGGKSQKTRSSLKSQQYKMSSHSGDSFSSTSGQSTPEQERMELRSYSCRQAAQNENGNKAGSC